MTKDYDEPTHLGCKDYKSRVDTFRIDSSGSLFRLITSHETCSQATEVNYQLKYSQMALRKLSDTWLFLPSHLAVDYNYV